jgi:hypothetical protein
MLATVEGQVLKLDPRQNTYPAKNGRAEKIEKFTEVTLLQTVPNQFEAGKTDPELVRVRSFNGAHEKFKVGDKATFPSCVIRAYVPGRGGSPVLTADSR